jgi:hypothetical protein
MDKELKAAWIAALRSGDFGQGSGVLLQDGRHCCLGVLCDIDSRVEMVRTDGRYYRAQFDLPKGVAITDMRSGEATLKVGGYNLPPEYRKALGISISEESKLVHLNDMESKSFVEIADYIEENL